MERIDDLHIQDYRIIQNPQYFCFGMDAVLLSSFARVKANENVLDLGTGTGIIPILLEAKTQGAHFTGLEIQAGSVDMAQRSVRMNKQEEKIDIVQGDIKEAKNLFSLASFQVITSNPPYMNTGKGLVNGDLEKAIARHEVLCNLEDVVSAAAGLLAVGGRFYMVHRPERLVEIIETLKKYRLEPKRMRFVHAYVEKEANMVLIEAIRYGNPMIKIENPLVIYQSKGKYSKEIYDIYGYEELS